MKTLFVSLAVLLFAFFVGCQSSITDPVVTDKTNQASVYSENFASKDWISSLPGEIKLDGTLGDPSQLISSFAEIEGGVRYSVTKVYFDSRPPTPQYAFNVQLAVKANLYFITSGVDKPWSVEERSRDLVHISFINESEYYLEKRYRIRNYTESPLYLVLKFRVSENQLQLITMKLKNADGFQTIGDPES